MATIDNLNDGTLKFAGKLDSVLFENTPVYHQDRDQDKMKWLMEVIPFHQFQFINRIMNKLTSGRHASTPPFDREGDQ